jgi:hypothetical protein
MPTPEERRTNTLEVDMTASLASELKGVSKKVRISTENTDMSEDDEAPEPMDVEGDAVYAKRYDADMDICGPDKTVAETCGERRLEAAGGDSEVEVEPRKVCAGRYQDIPEGQEVRLRERVPHRDTEAETRMEKGEAAEGEQGEDV